MPNRLSKSLSPYLLQHADDPVDWYPWGEEALNKAKEEQKPIFLSIGYSACHWCHVMRRESFQHKETAEIMNKLYINIKVDKEERPDLDKIHLQSLMLMIGGAGWPANLWLTPELKPYHGGTYIPHIPQPGAPSLAQQLLFLGDAWKNKREEVEASGNRVTAVLKEMSNVNAPPLGEGVAWLDQAVQGCELQYDDSNGGFGKGAKFPQPQILRFLLLRAIETEDTEVFELVDHTAQAMGRGGLFDQLGGGFHRYCVDPEWNVPHFEKMLSDNAQLCSFYAELYAHTKKPFYKWVVDSLVLWLEREMLLDEGGFCTSTDAESEQVEGRAFVWTRDQLAEIFDENERQMFASFYNVSAEGNFGDKTSVLTQRKPISKCAKELGWDFELAVRVLESAREKAFDSRQTRVQPGRDEKVVACFNGQMVSALCLAARLTQTEDAEELAVKCGEFLLSNFGQKSADGTYPRVWSKGKAYGQSLSEDLGSLCLSFFDLYGLTLDPKWFDKAVELYGDLTTDYWDGDKRLAAQTSPETKGILLRPYVFEDNPSPSGNSLFLECARHVSRLTDNADALATLQTGLDKIAPLASKAPSSFGHLLRTAHLHQTPAKDLVVGGGAEQASAFMPALSGKLIPGLMVSASDTPGLNPEMSLDRQNGKAYYCKDNSCTEPAENSEQLATLIGQ